MLLPFCASAASSFYPGAQLDLAYGQRGPFVCLGHRAKACALRSCKISSASPFIIFYCRKISIHYFF